MADSFAITIVCLEGDRYRSIEVSSRKGLAYVFSRASWNSVREEKVLKQHGVYILASQSNAEDGQQHVYIGQTDTLQSRIDSHLDQKKFWDVGVAYFSENNQMHRSQTVWLEYELIRRTNAAKRCSLDNRVNPDTPNLDRITMVHCKEYLKELLLILPLAGMDVFEQKKEMPKVAPSSPVAQANQSVVQRSAFSKSLRSQHPFAPAPAPSPAPAKSEKKHIVVPASSPNSSGIDTVVVSAGSENFERMVIEGKYWSSIRLHKDKFHLIKYIAFYRTAPHSAITHYAPVAHIEPSSVHPGKQTLVFAEEAKPIGPIPKGANAAMQGHRFTNLERLKSAKDIRGLR